jgi:hypothetical protein
MQAAEPKYQEAAKMLLGLKDRYSVPEVGEAAHDAAAEAEWRRMIFRLAEKTVRPRHAAGAATPAARRC